VHRSKLKQITVALCMALVPISVFAAGLGKLNVMSGLGEPLKADIELISVTAEELSSISAAIASEEAYAIQGIEKPASHNTIKVDIAKNAAGAPILKLKSSQPISEPFLDMLIQVDWASGRLLREYTVLLDPPGYTGEADPNAQDTQTAQVPLVKSFSKNKKTNSANTMADDNVPADVMPADDAVKPSKRSKKAKPAPDAEMAGEASGEDYKTQRGDTLAKIAQSMKPEGVSLEQMLIGLYQTNPNAFQGDNINRLKVGQILRQPSQDTLNGISRKAAAGEVKVQTANWNAYRNKLAGIVADVAPTDSEASTQSAGGKIKSAEDKSEAATAGPKDVVKLSAGDANASKASDENIKSLQAKISALQEEATAREKSVKEAQDRTASLEKQIADMQKLLAMKNGAMADIQKQAEADNKPAEMPAPPVEPIKPAETEAANPEPAKPVEQAKVEPAAPVAAPEKEKVKPAVQATEIAPVEEPGFLASMMGGLDLGILAPAGGLLALLGGGWMYLRKKREKNLADFEQGIMTSGGLKANTVFGNTASASVDTGDTSFLTDFSQSTNGGMIDTNDVDPIAEAEVYMAYGRDAQAEEILKDAISKEPKRHELHLKLLEMYAASKNLSAFETIAGELYTSLGAEDPMWAKVAEIGIKLEPNNPLYQANSAPTGMGENTGENLDASDFSNTPLAAEKDLDFSFDNESLVQNFAEDKAAAAPAVDEAAFDLPQFDEIENAVSDPAEVVAAESPVENNDALNFDMGDFADLNSNAAGFENTGVAASDSEANFGNTMPALDVPTFDAPKFIPDALADAGKVAVGSVLGVSDAFAGKVEEVTSFDELNAESFEFLQVDTPEVEAVQEIGVLDISGAETEFNAAEFNTDTDFNFDVDTTSSETATNVADSAHELNAFDLNTIDLEMNDGLTADVAESTTEAEIETPAEMSISGAEPIEVETKLDLVAAYIEMEDKEGAKELLAEVMKEGGAGQRKRAEVLLAQIA
jgi:pilus assembly protein FimV